jgi:hypothetical protein
MRALVVALPDVEKSGAEKPNKIGSAALSGEQSRGTEWNPKRLSASS